MNHSDRFVLHLLTSLFLLTVGSSAACLFPLSAENISKKPNIKILATGGTIAGTGTSAVSSSYQVGQVDIEGLLNAVPQLNELAYVTGEQIVNIGSQDMSDEVMLRLSKRVNELMNDPAINGIVITHGTDTMEETAFFLSLTTQGDKPVILVGSMRPSTSLSADGPMNLYQAVLTASSPISQGRGVMVVMNGFVYSAADVIKIHTMNPETFQAPNKGAEGYITDNQITYYNNVLSESNKSSPFFDVSKLKTLPNILQPILQGDYKGMVYAGVRNGNFHKNLTEVLAEISQKGGQIVRSARVSSEPVNQGEDTSKFANPVLYSGYLNPQNLAFFLYSPFQLEQALPKYKNTLTHFKDRSI